MGRRVGERVRYENRVFERATRNDNRRSRGQHDNTTGDDRQQQDRYHTARSGRTSSVGGLRSTSTIATTTITTILPRRPPIPPLPLRTTCRRSSRSAAVVGACLS